MTRRALPPLAALIAALAGAAEPATAGPSKKDLLAARGADDAAVGAAAVGAAASSAPVLDRTRWQRELRRRLGKKPAGVINVYNTWTHEVLVVEAGHKGPIPPEVASRFLRCHFTNHETTMGDRLFGVLLQAAHHFKVRRVEIISGFRAPKYNLMLRKKGRRVARDSQHTHGRAVDFRLPGVSTERLRDWARRLRLGGVGYYQHDGFVHVDTGPVRYWAE